MAVLHGVKRSHRRINPRGWHSAAKAARFV